MFFCLSEFVDGCCDGHCLQSLHRAVHRKRRCTCFYKKCRVLPQVRQLPDVQSRILLFVLFAPHPHGIHDGLQAPAPRGPFFLFYGTDAVLVKQGPGTPHIRLKKFFCSPNCEKSAVHRKSFQIITGQKSPAGNQVTALCVLYAGQKGVYHGLVSRGTPRCPAHPMQ